MDLQLIESKFKANRWRFTSSARQIVDALINQNVFISAYELEALLEEELNVTTVYRTLEKLQKLKLAHEFQGKWKWCENPKNEVESHHFLICERCDNAEEIFLDYKAGIADQLAREKNFILTKVHLGFLGICKSCHGKK